MKRIIFTAILSAAGIGLFAQTTPADTAKTVADTAKVKKGGTISIGNGDDTNDDSESNKGRTTAKHYDSAYPKFSLGITLSRLDLGLTTLVDNGSFTLTPQNQFLRYRSWKSSNAGFDLLQIGVRFSDDFKIYLSAGFDWTNIRLRDNITILPNEPSLTYRQDDIIYSKNRFTSSYLRLPLSFDFRTNENADGKRFHFVIGPDGGFLLTASVKQISAEHGKQKVNDTYNYATFRYGAFTRVGYGAWGIYAKYYFNPMFENSPAQEGISNFSFGIMLGF